MKWKRIVIGAAVAVALAAGGFCLLVRALQPGEARYRGQPLAYWVTQLNGQDIAASNEASLVVSSTIIPRLTETMFHDTNDSHLRLALAERLNSLDLPGVQVYGQVAAERRAAAALMLGQLGPKAVPVIPDLIKALHGTDPAPRPAAARALGTIKSEPDKVIPLLTALLDDPQPGVPEGAAYALGRFGSLSKPALPKLLELLKSVRGGEGDAAYVVGIAVQQIDPEEAARVLRH